MAKEKAPVVLIRAVHATRKDRKGNPVEKTFTESAWNSLHDDNWSEVGGKAPAPLKARTPSTAKKIAAKKPASKPKALKAKTTKK